MMTATNLSNPPVSLYTKILFNVEDYSSHATSCSMTVNKNAVKCQNLEILFGNRQSAQRFRSCIGEGRELAMLMTLRESARKQIKLMNHGLFVLCMAMICGLDWDITAEKLCWCAKEISNNAYLSKAVGLEDGPTPHTHFRTVAKLGENTESTESAVIFYRWFIKAQMETTPTGAPSECNAKATASNENDVESLAINALVRAKKRVRFAGDDDDAKTETETTQ